MIPILLIVGPLFAIMPKVFINQSGSPKLIAIGVGLYLALLRPSLNIPKAQKQAIGFLLACLVSFVFAQNRWIAFIGAPKAMYFGIVEIALVVLAYCVGARLDEEPYDLFIWCGAILGAMAICQAVTGHSFNTMPLQNARASGLRFSPVMFAASLIPCALAVYSKGRNFKGRPAVTAICLTLILLGMACAQAKGAIFAFLVGMWVYETEGLRRWAGALLSLCILWIYVAHSQAQNNLERMELIRLAWEAFKAHPLVGWGPDNFIIVMLSNRSPQYSQIMGNIHSVQASAHQDIAQVAATLGVIGLAAYASLMWALIKASSDRFSMAVLVSMWIQAQVNPIPVDVLVLVALLLGYCHKTDKTMTYPAWIAPTVLALVVFVVTLDLNPNFLAILR